MAHEMMCSISAAFPRRTSLFLTAYLFLHRVRGFRAVGSVSGRIHNRFAEVSPHV